MALTKITPSGLDSTQNYTANTFTANTITANNLVLTGSGFSNWTVYELDDLSYATDGFTNTFKLSYNQNTVSFTSPFNIEVRINGLVQPAFDYKYDTVWLSNVLTASKGYCIDYSGNPTSNGYIKFADCPPQGSQITIRTVGGTPTINPKVYPFKPLDVLMGY